MGKRMPSDLHRPIKYFGWLTWKDLLRLSLPGTVSALVTYSGSTTILLGSVVIGIFLGLIWYGVRPYGNPLEIYLYHRIRWIVFKKGNL